MKRSTRSTSRTMAAKNEPATTATTTCTTSLKTTGPISDCHSAQAAAMAGSKVRRTGTGKRVYAAPVPCHPSATLEASHKSGKHSHSSSKSAIPISTTTNSATSPTDPARPTTLPPTTSASGQARQTRQAATTSTTIAPTQCQPPSSPLPTTTDAHPIPTTTTTTFTRKRKRCALDNTHHHDHQQQQQHSSTPTWLQGSLEDAMFNILLANDCKYLPRSDYLTSVQTKIDANVRSILLDWLIEVGVDWVLHDQTFWLAVNYVDRFLSLEVLI